MILGVQHHDVAPLKIITYRAIKTTGSLIFSKVIGKKAGKTLPLLPSLAMDLRKKVKDLVGRRYRVSRMGMRKARVFPLPVTASAATSAHNRKNQSIRPRPNNQCCGTGTVTF